MQGSEKDPVTAGSNFRKRIAELGGTIHGEYQGQNTPIKCVCDKGHECYPLPSTVRDGGGMCTICSRKDPIEVHNLFKKRSY